MSDNEVPGATGEVDGYEMVMPFVACASHGGPYDDDSFVAGWECGAVDAVLATMAGNGIVYLERWVHSLALPQLDLVAMRHGFRVSDVEVEGESNWSWVTFTNAADDHEDLP